MGSTSRRLRVYSSLAVLGALPGAASVGRCQSVGQMIKYDAQHALHDMVETWGAPATASRNDWAAAASVVGAAGALSAFDANIDSWFVRHRQNEVFTPLRVFREGGKLFAGRAIVPLAVSLYAAGIAGKNRSIRDGVSGCAASFGLESIVRTQVIYRIIGRLRPDSLRGERVMMPSEYGDQYQFYVPSPDAWGKHSMPAGHVANVMACASFLANRFHTGYVAVPAYAITTAVGLGRLVDRRHWSSDTMLGVALGYVIGKEIARRSRDRLDSELPLGVEHAMARGPFIDRSHNRLSFGWSGQF